jgi:hypothetical protein
MSGNGQYDCLPFPQNPWMKEECELEHVYKWTGLFVFMYNAVRSHIKVRLLTRLIGGDIP